MNYSGYFKNHYKNISDSQIKYSDQYFKNNLWDYINNLDRWIDILEIWPGQWMFARYVKKLWFTKYTWFEIDMEMMKELKNIYPEYSFYSTDVIEFLKENDHKFDFIFMTNVFEHFEIEKWQILIESILNWLRKWGSFINIMPNAWSIFMASYWRYNDITHHVLYTENSFNHLLLNAWFKSTNIIHKNIYFCNPNKVKQFFYRGIQRIFISFMKYLLLVSWYPCEKVTTFEIFTQTKK